MIVTRRLRMLYGSEGIAMDLRLNVHDLLRANLIDTSHRQTMLAMSFNAKIVNRNSPRKNKRSSSKTGENARERDSEDHERHHLWRKDAVHHRHQSTHLERL